MDLSKLSKSELANLLVYASENQDVELTRAVTKAMGGRAEAQAAAADWSSVEGPASRRAKAARLRK
jgi:hypothetical protein